MSKRLPLHLCHSLGNDVHYVQDRSSTTHTSASTVVAEAAAVPHSFPRCNVDCHGCYRREHSCRQRTDTNNNAYHRRRRRRTMLFSVPTIIHSIHAIAAVFILLVLLSSSVSALQIQRLFYGGGRRTVKQPTTLCKRRDGHSFSSAEDVGGGSSGSLGNKHIGDAAYLLRSSAPPASQMLAEPVLAPISTTALRASSRRGGGNGRDDGSKRRDNGSNSAPFSASTAMYALSAESRRDLLVREMDRYRGIALSHLREQDLSEAFRTVRQMAVILGQRACEDADHTSLSDAVSVKVAASEIVDDTIKSLVDVAFSRGGGSDAADRVALGVKALNWQASAQSNLSHPFDAVPRTSWIKALRALTGLRNVQHICGTTPADASFGILQRLVTGFGVRASSDAKAGAYDLSAPEIQELDERDFSMVLNTFVNTGRMDMAHRVVALQERTEAAPPLSAVAYSIMIKGYGKLKDADNIEMILSHARNNGIAPDTVMYNSLIDAYVNCDLLDKARGAFAALTGRSQGDMSSMPTPDVRSYNTMLKGFAKKGELRNALELSKNMESAGLWSEVTTNTLVKAAVVAREFNVAEDILRRFTDKSSSVSSKKQHPNMKAYTDLIDGYGKARMLDRALATFKSMRERGVVPNEYTYTCLISAMVRNDKLIEANALLDAMESAGVAPTVVTYNAFITGLLDKAPAPVASSDVSPDDFVSEDHTLYNECIVDSLRLLGKMVKSNVCPNDTTVSLIVRGLGKCYPPRVEQAKSIVKKLDEDKKVSRRNERVGTALINTCGDNGDFESVEKAFHDIAEPDVIALNAFLDACCKCNEVKIALETFDDMTSRRSKATRSDRAAIRPDVISYTILISALLEIGTVSASSRAHTLYDNMKSRGIKADIALVDIILSAMIGGGSLGLDNKDIMFTRKILRDAEGLNWAPGQLEERIKEVKFLLFGRMSEVWKNDEASFGIDSLSLLVGKEEEDAIDPLFERKGWNRVDSGFRLWGGGLGNKLGTQSQVLDDDDENGVTVDEFLESHGWNDVDSGFRLF